MSHAATNWAIKQRGIKPASKIVLWQLCDRFHPDNGCFPSQESLAEDCEMSRSSLNSHLNALEARGLIARETRRDPQTKQQERTRYRFPFEPDFEAKTGGEDSAEPCPESEHGAESEKEQKPCPENGQSRVRNPDTNLVREPVTEPSVERDARAGESEKPPEPTAADRKRFDDAVKAHWPNLALDDSERGFTAWFALTVDQRAAALDRIPDFVALHRSKKRDHLPALSTYFRQLRFEALPPKPADGSGLSVALPARSEGWCAMFFRLAISGSTQSTFAARRMLADAEFDRPAWCRSDEIPGADCWPKIERGSEQFKVWRKHLGEQGIWLKPECFGVWLWVPSEWPQEDVMTAMVG